MMDWDWVSNMWFYMILGMVIFIVIAIILIYILTRRNHQDIKVNAQIKHKSASAKIVEDINHKISHFCPNCGEKLNEKTIICPYCGSEI